jgi:hypothetical protein
MTTQTATTTTTIFDLANITPDIKQKIQEDREIRAQIDREYEDFASKPFPGYGCTVILYSDRHAATITRVSPSGKTFWYRQDKATRIDTNGMSDYQTYSYEPDPDAPEIQVRMTKKGWKNAQGSYVAVGYHREYYDYSF